MSTEPPRHDPDGARIWQPSLDGLTVPEPAAGGTLHAAAVASLAALDEAGVLAGQHALTAQLILNLSAAIDRALASGRLQVATSQSVRQLLDAIASLPAVDVDATSAEDDVMARFEAALRDA